MPRRIPSKVATLSAVAATALILDPTSSCAYAFTPTPGTASSLRTSGPLHLSSNHAAESFVPRNSLHSLDGRTMASSSMRIPPTSTSRNLASRRDRMMVLHAAKNEGGDIDYANMKPQVYPQRWVQLAYLSLLALLVSFLCRNRRKMCSKFFSCADCWQCAHDMCLNCNAMHVLTLLYISFSAPKIERLDLLQRRRQPLDL